MTAPTTAEDLGARAYPVLYAELATLATAIHQSLGYVTTGLPVERAALADVSELVHAVETAVADGALESHHTAALLARASRIVTRVIDRGAIE